MIKSKNPKTDGVMDNYEPEDEDEIGMRLVEVDGIEYKLTFKDPYGFAIITPQKGKTPVELEGQYTTQTLAELAIKQYHSKLKEKNKLNA